MPSVWRIQLHGEPVLPNPAHLHAVVCGWLDEVHDEKDKHWNIGRVECSPDGLRIDIAMLLDGEAARLLTIRGTPVRLGKQTYEIGPSVELVSIASWWSLYELAQAKPHVRFRFNSPLFVRRDEFTPVLFLGHLRRRFSAFCGDPELQPDLAFGHLGLRFTDIALTSEPLAIKVDSGKELRGTGYTGSITIEAPNASERELRVMHALSLLAPYVGLGAYTTMGFGCVSVD